MSPIHHCFQKISPGNHFSYRDQGPGFNSNNNEWIISIIELDLYFYDYITVYAIWIQYTNEFKKYRPETIFHIETKGHNSDNNWWILSEIELDLYFMIIYLCMKYESNTPMYSKDTARKPFLGRDVRTRVMIYAHLPTPPPLKMTGGGGGGGGGGVHNNKHWMELMGQGAVWSGSALFALDHFMR